MAVTALRLACALAGADGCREGRADDREAFPAPAALGPALLPPGLCPDLAATFTAGLTTFIPPIAPETAQASSAKIARPPTKARNLRRQ
jgi:hypothetical protein